MRRRAVILTMLLATGLVASAAVATAQRRFGRGSACATNWDADNYFVSPFFAGNPTYDGRITFARIKYQGGYECGGEGPGWSHDYPRTESHFMKILRELSTVRTFTESGPIIGSIVVRLDDPAIPSRTSPSPGDGC